MVKALTSISHNVQSFILNLFFYFWQKKKELIEQGHEAVSDDNIAKIHIEEKAVQLFLWADTEDRAANFNKQVDFF